jgi:Sec-independent protein translocase protein TatA
MAEQHGRQQVSLGCGSLILIALIVLIVGSGKIGNVEREVQGLRSEVRDLKKSVDAQTEQIKTLGDEVERLHGVAPDPDDEGGI